LKTLMLMAALFLVAAGEGADPGPEGTRDCGSERVAVGAIRWDAWTGGKITAQVERTLGPEKYHDRLPWFAEVLDEDRVRINGAKKGVMEKEIDMAAQAGLDYWAFLVYPKASPMTVALDQYLASPKRKRIRFCVIMHNTFKATSKHWPAERDRAVALLKEPGYQTVLNGRPLVYVFAGRDLPFDRFIEFRAAVRKAGLNPYCVFMGWNPASDYRRVRKKGFDAVSAYAMAGSQARFSDLVRAVETRYWQAAVKGKVSYVPFVTSGWDKWPRKDNPVSWEKKGQGYHKQKVFPSRAKPQEIAAHLKRGVSFVKSHPGTCAARALIIYAWNEYDEGGWIAPTRGADGRPDTSRLDAIRKVLKPARSKAEAGETR